MRTLDAQPLFCPKRTCGLGLGERWNLQKMLRLWILQNLMVVDTSRGPHYDGQMVGTISRLRPRGPANIPCTTNKTTRTNNN